MINLKGKFGISEQELFDIISEGYKHPWYNETMQRAREMSAYYEATDIKNWQAIKSSGDKTDIIPKSDIENNSEYQEKINRMRIFPFEQKFYESEQRIYDENNVQREYLDEQKDFFQWLESNFDDNGDNIDKFAKDKALFIRSVLGFGGVNVSIAVDKNLKTLRDNKYGLPVPYSYTVQPSEIMHFSKRQGFTEFVVLKQKRYKYSGEAFHEIYGYTPDVMSLWRQEKGDDKPKEVKTVPNPFSEVPFVFLKGAMDRESGFRVGRPVRFALTGLYMACSELFYDIQRGSLLFAHPIPAYPESLIKQMMGIQKDDKDQNFDNSAIKEKIGMCVVYPDGLEPPNQLFYQADMGGLEYLRKVLFDNLFSIIFLFANIRDKSKVAHNISGKSKAMDNTDEQGLLGAAADDMEAVENKIFRLMYRLRGVELPQDQQISKYSKFYDLSSVAEIYEFMTNGAQYNAYGTKLHEYLETEFARKLNAPATVVDAVKKEVKEKGKPMKANEITALSTIMDQTELLLRARPEIASGKVKNMINKSFSDLRSNTIGQDNGNGMPGNGAEE